MKLWTIVAAVALAACLTNPACSDEVPRDTLAEMGLSAMEPMTDAQGEAIRGQWTIAYSNLRAFTWATQPGTLAATGAIATATGTNVRTFASGYSLSIFGW